MTDVALLSLGTTLGLRHADDVLAGLIAEAGCSCRLVRVRIGATGRLRRHIAVTDLVEGLAARRAARGLRGARAVIVSSATTALLLDRPSVPWALRFDAPAVLNRTGPSGAWQRARERRVLPRADVLLPWGEAAADAARPLLAGSSSLMLPLPVPVEVPAVTAAGSSDEVVAYAGWMDKRGVDLLLDAWRAVAAPGLWLTIGGADTAAGRAWLARRGLTEPPQVRWAGVLPRDQWLARVAGARAYVNASRREDHGLGPLEALALGTPLVTVPSGGAYEALPLARRLAPALVARDVSGTALAKALSAGLALPDRPAYAAAARAELDAYGRDRVLAVVRDELLPALGLRA